MTENYSEGSSSPKQMQILKGAGLEKLYSLYRECKRHNVPYNTLVKEIENEIYRKWTEANAPKGAFRYKLKKTLRWN